VHHLVPAQSMTTYSPAGHHLVTLSIGLGLCCCRELFDTEMDAARAYDTAVWRLKPREASVYANFKDTCPPDVAEVLKSTDKVGFDKKLSNSCKQHLNLAGNQDDSGNACLMNSWLVVPVDILGNVLCNCSPYSSLQRMHGDLELVEALEKASAHSASSSLNIVVMLLYSDMSCCLGSACCVCVDVVLAGPAVGPPPDRPPPHSQAAD